MSAVAVALMLVSALLAGPAAGQSVSPDDPSTIIYGKDFFARYNVTTALDMLRRVPGISALLDAAINPGLGVTQVRGFGSGGDQILINRKRIAGKANEISAALERIQAAQVERIELIRGTAAGVAVRSEGQIVNIVVAAGAGAGGVGSWRASGRFSETGKIMPGGFLSYGGNWGGLQYLVSLETAPRFQLLKRAEEFFDADGKLFELRREREKRPEKRTSTLTANLIYPFANGDELRVNGLYLLEEVISLEISNQSAVDPSGAASFVQTEITDGVTDKKKWEVGVDYEKRLGESGRFKVIFIANREVQDGRKDQSQLAGGGTTVLTLETADVTIKETILRLSFGWDLSRNHNLEIGAEGARNSLASDLRIFADQGGALAEIDLLNPDSTVRETRFEGFVTDKWKISRRLSAEIGLNGEISRLTQKGSEIDNANRFFFLKPRLDLRFDVTPSEQWRLKAERTVKQLEFNDFVAEFDFQDDEVDFGNPRLEPENAWEFEARYERRLKDDNGVLEARVFWNEISDHIDKGPIDVDRDGVADRDGAGLLREAAANIGGARLYGGELKASLRMVWFGVPEAVLNLRFKALKTRTTDPFTGARRRMFRKPNFDWTAGFRHDLTKAQFSYGATVDRRVGVRRTDEVRATWLFTDDLKVSAFVETRLFGAMTLRLEGKRLLRDKAKRIRRIYLTNVANGDIRRVEDYDRTSDRSLLVTLRGNF